MLKAIIFDFDGVIGDTYQMGYMLSKEADPLITEQDFQDHHNGNVWDTPKIKFTPESAQRLFKKQKQIFQKENLFPVEEILRKLSQKYRIYIISSGTEENILHFLSLGGIDGYIARIMGLETHKSKVEKFKMLFSEYTLDASECIFITDTIGDIKEGSHIGVKTIAVTWGYHPKTLLESENPYKTVDSIEELYCTIQSIHNES